MEPITHFLTGACLGRAGFNRKTALATATMALAAEAPDADSLYYSFGTIIGFEHHRGWTHTVLGAPIVALLVVLLMFGYYRWSVSRGRWKHESPPRWGWLYGGATVAALSHILLDFTNNYGVRPFMPFSYRWYSWDIVFIIEPLLWIFLVVGLVAPAFFGLIDSEVGAKRRKFRGRGAAIAALILMVVLWGFRDYQHRRAVAALESLSYDDLDAQRVSAFPYWLNPFRWYGVVETETFYQSMELNTATGEVDPQRSSRVYWKPEETPASLAAKNSPVGRVFLDWAQYPVTEVTSLSEPEGGYFVRFYDVRFAYPGREGTLGAWVKLDPNLTVVSHGFGRGSRRESQPESRAEASQLDVLAHTRQNFYSRLR